MVSCNQNIVSIRFSIVPFQIAAYDQLMKYECEVKGRARYGVRAFADALLVIPKTLGKLFSSANFLLF